MPEVMLREELKRAIGAEAASIGTFLIVGALSWYLGAGPAPAILGTAIAVGLSRRQHGPAHLHLAIEALILPALALVAAAAGALLRLNLIAGAAVFTICVAASVAARGLGGDARRVAAAIGLPFIMMLVVPAPHRDIAGAFLTVGAALIALLLTAVVRRGDRSEAIERIDRPRQSSLVPPANIRMALQVLVALATAFAVGAYFFPDHWPWIVLSAYIVSSGALGRSDAVHKGAMRLAGALGGGILAFTIAYAIPSNGVIDACIIFAVLFAGLLLRDTNYAFWAAATTTIFAILAQLDRAFTPGVYGVRLACITLGALIGIVAACSIFPMRTSDIARRRLADLLASLEAVFQGDETARRRFRYHVMALRRLRAPLSLHRIVGRTDVNHPSSWIAIASAFDVDDDALARVDAERLVSATRIARRAIRDRGDVASSLDRVRQALR